MPHFKCVSCRTRLYSRTNPPEQVGDLCPDCGSLLEPADNLAELVGFRSVTAQARLDSERWIDDGGSLAAEAVALPPPRES